MGENLPCLKTILFFKYGIGIGNQSNTVSKMFFFPTWTESTRWTEFGDLWTMSGHGTQTQAQRVVNTMRIRDEQFKISNWYNILRLLFRVLRITLKILFQCRKMLMQSKMFKYIGYHVDFISCIIMFTRFLIISSRLEFHRFLKFDAIYVGVDVLRWYHLTLWHKNCQK